MASQAGADPGVQAEAVNEEEADDEAVGLLTLWWIPVAQAAMQQATVEQRDFFAMARRVLAYLRRSGVSMQVMASALMELIWRRGDNDYLMQAEEFFVELDLPIDVDRCRSDDLQAEAHALIRLVEDGLWGEFVDHLEGLVGESQQVGDARAQQTLSEEEREAWWQWAEHHTSQGEIPIQEPCPQPRERCCVPNGQWGSQANTSQGLPGTGARSGRPR